MRIFKILIFIVLTTSLQAQTDSLAVKIAGDTVVITNYRANENCCSAFGFDIQLENDSILYITEIDAGDLCTCNCYFDLEIKILDLAAGTYLAKIYRDWETFDRPVMFIGEISFSFQPSQVPQQSIKLSGIQGDCYYLTSLDEPEQQPGEFQLLNAYPNPFNTTIRIAYSIITPHKVKLSIYDLQGKEIVVLVNRKESPGIHQVMFDASQYSSGVYILLLKTAGKVDAKKIILLK